MEAILIVMTMLITILFFLLIRQKMTMEKLLEQQISLSENVAELKAKLDEEPAPKPDSVVDTVEQQIADAKEKIFTEWIQNIANYNPFSHGE